MKPQLQQYTFWVSSTIHGNGYLHMPPRSPDALTRMVSLAADPDDVRHFDARAADLLAKARAAHDELTAYLQARLGVRGWERIK